MTVMIATTAQEREHLQSEFKDAKAVAAALDELAKVTSLVELIAAVAKVGAAFRDVAQRDVDNIGSALLDLPEKD